MQNEIPFSQEKSSKSLRLREAARRLRDSALDRPLPDTEWEDITGDLTQDDLDHLYKMARGHLDRAADPIQGTDISDIVDEARSAVLLWPRDPGWTREVSQTLRALKMKSPQITALLSSMDRRVGKQVKRKRPRWILPGLVVLLAFPLGVWAAIVLWPGMNLGSPVTRVQGPRALEATFDTQGVKTNIQVADCKLLIFPEATVAELSAWVLFPDHAVDEWSGTVSILDPQGQVLAKRDVDFHPANQGPLQPGQGVQIFEQFDAWPFLDKVASFQVTTEKIVAKEAHPTHLREMPVSGTENLTPGFNLKVWIQDDQWGERFAERVHTLNLEIENTGLKPFAELQFALVWHDTQGKVLKTITFRPVSAFRTALPSGAKMGWKQETVFDTEVFSWPPGQDPTPVLELRRWQ